MPIRSSQGLHFLVAAFVVISAGAGLPRASAGQTGPDEVGRRRQQAEQLRREHRHREALAAYRAVLALEPGGFEDRFWVAKLESWTGGLAAADSTLLALLGERPDDYDSRVALADVRLWRGDSAGARAVLGSLRRTHPEDPEVIARAHALRQRPSARWEADLEYFGERLPGGAVAHGGTLSLGARHDARLRWRAIATVQEKFDRTESRVGAEVGLRPSPRLELAGSVHLAPGAEVLPRGSYGIALSRVLGSRVVAYAEYSFLDYLDAEVHQVGPAVELYAGRWLLAGRYRWIATFSGLDAPADDHAGTLTIGRFYGAANLVRLFGAAGRESFTQPSRDLIGRFEAYTLGLAWRHFLTPGLGLEALFAHQERSGGPDQDSYGLRVVRRW